MKALKIVGSINVLTGVVFGGAFGLILGGIGIALMIISSVISNDWRNNN